MSCASMNLVVALAQKLEFLGFLVHKDAVQMACVDGADLDGLVAPAHDLVRRYVC